LPAGACDAHCRALGPADRFPYAPDRVLWGTDWPRSSIAGDMPNDGATAYLLALFAGGEASRPRILAENPTRLYDAALLGALRAGPAAAACVAARR